MKKYKHIDFLNACAKNIGRLGDDEGEMLFDWLGLCSCACDEKIDDDLLSLFVPTQEDIKWLEWEGQSRIYWGSGASSGKVGILTPLRATIVMFMAAMNGEL